MTKEELEVIEKECQATSGVMWTIFKKYLRKDPTQFTEDDWKGLSSEIEEEYRKRSNTKYYAGRYAQLIGAYLRILSKQGVETGEEEINNLDKFLGGI